jgi:hypothetical protein
MKRIISLVMAVLLGLLLVGCGNLVNKLADNLTPPSIQQDSAEADPALAEPAQEEPVQEDPAQEEPAQTEPDVLQEPDTPAALGSLTAQESYTAFSDAKSQLINSISDALTSNPDTALAAMGFLGVTTVDLMVLPAAALGAGQEAAAMSLGFFGATDVQYTENGNQYMITYANSEGEKYEFNATYDPAADAMVFDVKVSGAEGGLLYEYRRTPYGYVAQIYSYEGTAVTELYQITIHETGGVIGVSTSGISPAVLTGSEAKDFPKGCPEWYALDGTAFACMLESGEKSFEYTPSTEE